MPRGIFYEPSGHNSVELFAPHNSRPISSLAYIPQQDRPLQHSSFVDQDRVQLDTPQPLINDAPLPWSKYTVSGDVQQQQSETTPSFNLLNLDSITEEEFNRLIGNAEESSLGVQAEFVVQQDQQVPVENGPTVNVHLDHNCADAGKELMAEFFVKSEEPFEGNNIYPQIIMGEETIYDENVSTFMNSNTYLEQWIKQLPNHGTQMGHYEEKPEMTAMSNEWREVKAGSPLTSSSSRSSSASQRSAPYSLYRERRNRNNEASRKSREKRKAKQEQNKEKQEELELQNDCLRAEVACLEAMVNEWKDHLLHALAGKEFGQQWLNVA
uniref:BZIP domain-containing protein n=1 Tax=Plectus sambesii TaxID=2011161 RepID=A0A914VWF2_9BILA